MSAPAHIADPAPTVLLPYQVEAIKLSDANEFLMIEKSRRTGLTYGFAADAVLKAAPSDRPTNVYYLSYNKDMTREFIGYCADFAKAFNEVATEPSEFLFDDGSEKGLLALRIDFPSGKSIVALSSKPRSMRGMQGKVIIDEAAFHDDLVGVHTAAMALTMWGDHVVAISTHNGTDNPFNTMIGDIRAKKLDGEVHKITLTDAISDGLVKRICLRGGKVWSPEYEAEWEAKLRKRYGDGSAEELDVIPARGSGTYLARATVEAAMTSEFPLIRLSCPDGFERLDMPYREAFIADWLKTHIAPLIARFDKDRWSYFGQDFARSSDLSVIAAGQIDAMLNRLARFVIEMRNVPFREQKQILDYLCDNMPLFASGKMDARGNGQQLAEDMQTDHGFDAIEAVMATSKTYLAMMPPLKRNIEDRTFLMPKAEPIVEDFRLLKQVNGVPMIVSHGDDKADGAKGKRHGDTVIALMHLNAAMDEDVGPMDIHVLGNRRAGSSEMRITDTGFGTVARRSSNTDGF